jgi:hypothetical protein
MTAFVYSPSGLLCWHAYSPAVYRATVRTKYAVRDVVYSRFAAAQRGRLEPVAIKRLYFVDPQFTGAELRVLYIDTLNGWWNESDLLTQSEAQAVAGTYRQRVAAEQARLAKEIHGGCR